MVVKNKSLTFKNVSFKDQSDHFQFILNSVVNSKLEKLTFEGCFIPHSDKIDFKLDKDLVKSRYLYLIAFINWEFEKRISTVINIISSIQGLTSIDLSDNDFDENEVNQITYPEWMKNYPELANIDFVTMYNNKKDLSTWKGQNLIC